MKGRPGVRGVKKLMPVLQGAYIKEGETKGRNSKST